jgi:methylenetetrahydrofolate--tRNA-(uracil-5-)-methyltransferase
LGDYYHNKIINVSEGIMKKFEQKILVVGAGLAGSEAAFSLAEHGVEVVLAECKRIKLNPAQKIPHFVELVCTNSLKSIQETSAHGLLKTEMEKLNSLVLKVGRLHAVPAGDALAVDRDLFAQEMTRVLSNHPLIKVIDVEVDDPLKLMRDHNCSMAVIASGPLTSKALENWILKEISHDDLYFYDAIAPVVDADSLDYSKLYFKDRHKEPDESADYLNAPMNKEEYYHFMQALVAAEKVPAKDFEDLRFFESCLPIDIMAERGQDTPRFSCMKPIGLRLPDGSAPFAVVQLRKENLLGSAFNLVGFQTRLTYKEQLRVFRMIPGFAEASFIHLGSVHRNSFLNAKKLLNWDLSSQKIPNIFFAGQITGVEGYTESASVGLYVAQQILRRLQDKTFEKWPVETCLGSLINYIMTSDRPAPSNVNFGLMPTQALTKEQRRGKNKKKARKELAAVAAKKSFDDFMAHYHS